MHRRRPGIDLGGAARRLFLLRSGSDSPCGVETFARKIAEAAGKRAEAPVLGNSLAALDGPGALVINLPVVAWKRNLAAPVLAALRARLRGLSVVVVLHEWADLKASRRASYLPLLLLARSLLFSCPAVERQFAASPASRWTTRRRSGVPIPPNLSHPGTTARSRHSDALAAERAAGKLVLGYFGAIYPKKQPLEVLDVAAELKRRGHRVAVVFAGSFIRGADAIERDFAARVSALGLDGAVTITGYIRTEAELFGIFEEVDVFLYRFAEGLTPRRASVLACLQSGKPVVVNAPRHPEEFDQHASYRGLLTGGGLCLVPTEAGTGELADAVLAARARPPLAPGRAIDVAAGWAEALAAIDAAAAEEPRPTRGGARRRASAPA